MMNSKASTPTSNPSSEEVQYSLIGPDWRSLDGKTIRIETAEWAGRTVVFAHTGENEAHLVCTMEGKKNGQEKL